MLAFHLAWEARGGRLPPEAVAVSGLPSQPPLRVAAPAWVVLGSGADLQARLARLARPESPAQILAALRPQACLSLRLDPLAQGLAWAARLEGGPPALYFRQADATVRPLPSAPASLQLQDGDTFVALSPGALAVTGGAALARFIREHDGYQAASLAAALLRHLAGLNGADDFPLPVAALVIDARR